MVTERRLHPRIATDLEAEIVSPRDRALLQARLLNLSLGGLRIGGNSGLRDQLTADPGSSPIQVEVSFELSGTVVRLTCRHIHTLRLSADAFEFGFKIVDYHNDAEARLEAFVAGHLSKP
jgi:hypothetical protein